VGGGKRREAVADDTTRAAIGMTGLFDNHPTKIQERAWVFL
jgi:hypothetical protein